MATPLLTVYMPAFNSEKYISEAINSILKQTFTDFEFIIIDDGSTDKTLEVISSFNDTRIRLICNEKNTGVRKSSNIALKEAKGKYIARMDSDDVSVQTRLEKQINFLESNLEIGVCGGQIELFGNEKGVWRFPLTDEKIKAALFWGTAICQGTSIIRSEVLKRNNLFYNEEGEPFAEDWQLWYKMKGATEFANLNEILLKYRRENQNITHLFRNRSFELNSLMHKKILNDFGIEASDYDLKLQMFASGQIIGSPTSQMIFDLKQWLNKLIKQNDKTKQYLPDAFCKNIEQKWNSLFYLLPPYGKEIVKEYYRISPKRHFAQRYYFFRYKMKMLTGI